jgi:hypothetical protein
MRYLFLILCFCLNACSKDLIERENVMLPFLPECQGVVEKVKNDFEELNAVSNHNLHISLEIFDKKMYHFSKLSGAIILSVDSTWHGSNDLSGLSAKEYLMIYAESIKADCYPNNFIHMGYKDIINLPSRIESMNEIYGDDIYIQQDDDGVKLYFNDGAYVYQ